MWAPYPFEDAAGIRIAAGMPLPCEADCADAVLCLARWEGGNAGEHCVLLRKMERPARINGLPALSVTALHARDEIALGWAPECRLYYSSESPNRIVPFHEGENKIFCARSKVHLTEGMPAVRCACGLWYLQSDEFPGFTYGEQCLGCGRPTSMGYVWTPPPIRKHARIALDEYRDRVRRRAAELAGLAAPAAMAG